MPRTAEENSKRKREAFRRKRVHEGLDFEQHVIAATLEPNGYVCTRSHMSKGPFDLAAFKIGQVLLIPARLTAVGAANASFSYRELADVWRLVEQLSRPGFDVRAVTATAVHAPRRLQDGTFGPCRCAGIEPGDVDPVRFRELVTPPVKAGGRAVWRPWTPDEVGEPVEQLVLAAG